MQKQFNLANGCLNLNEWFDLVFFFGPVFNQGGFIYSSLLECYKTTHGLNGSTVMIILNLIIKFKIIITVEAIKTMSSLVAL